MTCCALLLAATDATLPALPPIAQYGLLGAMFIALASGQFLVPRYVLDRERERSDRHELEVQRLNKLIQEQAIPAIVEASKAVQESSLLMRDVQRERDIEREVKQRGGG